MRNDPHEPRDKPLRIDIFKVSTAPTQQQNRYNWSINYFCLFLISQDFETLKASLNYTIPRDKLPYNMTWYLTVANYAMQSYNNAHSLRRGCGWIGILNSVLFDCGLLSANTAPASHGITITISLPHQVTSTPHMASHHVAYHTVTHRNVLKCITVMWRDLLIVLRNT